MSEIKQPETIEPIELKKEPITKINNNSDELLELHNKINNMENTIKELKGKNKEVEITTLLKNINTNSRGLVKEVLENDNTNNINETYTKLLEKYPHIAINKINITNELDNIVTPQKNIPKDKIKEAEKNTSVYKFLNRNKRKETDK